jgi:ATPase subunit of ABC transporter with duplicated ATPase domains
MDDACVIKSGNWHAPKISDIGYLDQHYGTLSAKKTVLETIAELVPTWPHIEVRRHLNDFLFRKNEEVSALVGTLSGGEKGKAQLGTNCSQNTKASDPR